MMGTRIGRSCGGRGGYVPASASQAPGLASLRAVTLASSTTYPPVSPPIDPRLTDGVQRDDHLNRTSTRSFIRLLLDDI
jgi:hypothetical protein